MEMATLDIEQAQQQLDRYAEDFGKLYKEYLEIRSQLDLALKDARAELFTKLYAHADHGIMVTDLNGSIMSVNPAFTAITGYAEEEVRGRTPRILSSGKQDKAFYSEMWRNLVEKGEWQGEIWNRRKSGEVYAEWLHIVKASDQLSGIERFVAMFYDISIHRNSRNHIYELANHDPLTGLPNRALCRDRLQQAIAQARRNGDGVGVMFIDLDRFKQINDTLGHAVGDKLLIDFSWRVVHAIRDSDTAARLGGDEFVVVAPGVTSESDMRVIAEKIIRSLNEPFLIEERELYVGASVGIALFPTHGDNVDDLLRQADTAMYAAKTSGGNTSRLFDDDLCRSRTQRLDMETALRHALAQQQFQLAYQPQVRAADGAIVGVEALLRWHWPGHGNVPPDRFIPVAEATGLIVPIGEWVMRSACMQQAAWQSAGLPSVRMAVNIAARQLSDPDFANRVAGILAEAGLPANMFELEITESQLMENLHIGLDNLVRLRTLGVTVAIDDFGTGHSSLGRIRSLPIDRIKVDKSFVVDVDRNPNSYAIAHAVLAMANALKLETIAEGVEHQDQANLLNAIKCTEFQGYLYGRPQSPEAIAALLAQQKGEMR